jgi:hypothetical protein
MVEISVYLWLYEIFLVSSLNRKSMLVWKEFGNIVPAHTTTFSCPDQQHLFLNCPLAIISFEGSGCDRQILELIFSRTGWLYVWVRWYFLGLLSLWFRHCAWLDHRQQHIFIVLRATLTKLSVRRGEKTGLPWRKRKRVRNDMWSTESTKTTSICLSAMYLDDSEQRRELNALKKQKSSESRVAAANLFQRTSTTA